ncbi:hypothetical protein MKK58_19885 [Methylobacterium sp. J-078]|uniref:hypothetical protein n=1 Tax=Methylobacterium sp. J-078 TaxID=2836657 RepID=UPI001FBBEBCA|nr:hypothetical protein [Methylobacterium sp. J-078]MCJ2046779.1 hypothetical protein [Methylobacterium sp. J-078]
MLRKLVSAALRRDLSEDDGPADSSGGAVQSVAAAAPPDPEFPPMQPVRPPAAENDNPLSGFCPTVEASLQAAGYLR